MKWLLLLKALRKGAVLAKPARWKTQQVVVTAILGALVPLYQFGIAMGWLPDSVNEGTLNDLATGIGVLLFALYSIFTTVATTEKIGFRPKPNGDPDDAGGLGDHAGPDSLRTSQRRARSGGMRTDPEGHSRHFPRRDQGPFLDGD